MYIYLMKNQVIRNAYVIEILWHCNVVEPVIKDVIVTEEYHVLHFMPRQFIQFTRLKILIHIQKQQSLAKFCVLIKLSKQFWH